MTASPPALQTGGASLSKGGGAGCDPPGRMRSTVVSRFAVISMLAPPAGAGTTMVFGGTGSGVSTPPAAGTRHAWKPDCPASMAWTKPSEPAQRPRTGEGRGVTVRGSPPAVGRASRVLLDT